MTIHSPFKQSFFERHFFLIVVVLAVLVVGLGIANDIKTKQLCAERGGHMRVVGSRMTSIRDSDGNIRYEEEAVKECQTTDGKWIPLD